MQKLPVFLLGLGVLFLIASVLVGWVIFPIAFEGKIKDQVSLKETGTTYEKWKDITMPIYMNYYFYNVTNPEDVNKKNGAKPIFDEIGPYVYKEKRAKTVHFHDDDDDTVTYQQAITYFFCPEMSGGRTEDDILTMINLPLVGIAYKGVMGEMDGTQIYLASEEITTAGETLFMTHTVREMLFQGYPEPVFKELGRLKGESILPNDTFGLAYGKNGTLGPWYEVQRGIRESMEFGSIAKWKNETTLNWWNGTTCNMINGTDGSVFPPFVTRDRVLSLFSDDLCRSLHLTYEKDIDYHGIPAYRFSLPAELLQRATDNPDNLCFCTFEDITLCKAGVINLGVCKKGAPIFASTPHFLYGEKEDAEMAGLHPDPEIHMTYIDLEPNTGVLLQASKKIQINIQSKPNKKLAGFKYAPDMLWPVMWADEYAALPEDKVQMVKDKVLSNLHVAGIAKWVVVGLSLVVILAGLAVLFIRLRQKRPYV